MAGRRKSEIQSGDERPTIGFITSSLAQEQMAEVWSGAVDAARERDVNLVCLPAEGGQGVRRVLYDLVPAESLDGLVTFQWWSSRQAFETVYERYRPLPVVNVMRLYEGYPGVAWSHRQVTHDLVSHLVEVHGYRRIAYIGIIEGNPVAEERYRAYVDALAEYGIPLDPGLVMPGDYPGRDGSGRRGVRFLMDHQNLQPKVDFEAVVAFQDAQALDALDELQERGLRVPYDVAVVGIDDLGQSAVSVPPLTTVSMPTQEMGRRAVEMLLAQLKGEDVSERVMVPGPLVIRQSCGCMDTVVLQAAAGTGLGEEYSVGESLESAMLVRREEIVAEMIQATGAVLEGVEDRVERVLDAFVADLTTEPTGSVGSGAPAVFLTALDDVLRLVDRAQGDVGIWQGVLSAMRRHLLPLLGADEQMMRRAEDLWQQGRLLAGRMAQHVQARQHTLVEQQATTERELATELLNAFDVAQVGDVVAEGLPRLGIPGCYLSLYESPELPSDRARLVIAYNDQGRIEMESGKRLFAPQYLTPEGVLPQKRSYSLVVEPLYSGTSQIGFAVFEAGPQDGTVYEALCEQLSSALWSIQLSKGRQLVQEALAQEQALLRALLENVPDHIYFKDLDSRFIRVSRSMVNLFDLDDPEQLVGKSDFDFFTEDHARPAYKDEQEIIRTGQPLLNQEERETWPDRPDTWVSTTKMPLLDENGQTVGTFGISRDITVRKQAEDERERLLVDVQQSEELLRSIIDATPDWIFVKDREHRFQLVNKGFADTFGLRPEDFIGKNDLEMGFAEAQVRGDLEKGIRGFWTDDQQVMDSGEPLVDPHDVTTIDGEMHISHTFKIPLRDAEGEVGGVLAFVRDVTDREQLVRDLERRSTQLQTAAEVSRAAGTILDSDELIERAVDLVGERFGFYYAGLFLVDDSGKWAVLQAGTGEPGRQMVERGHRLELGGDSMIGQCVARGEARIALDVGEEARRFDNPLLPKTRSEMALPLMTRGQTIGAMTIQSEVEAAFSDEDIASLQTMADQLAVAIGNARLFEETQVRTEELAVLNEMSRVLPTVLDVGEIVQRTYRYASRLMDTTNFYVALYDQERDEVSFPIYAEGDQIRTAGSRRAGHGMTEHIIRSRQPLLLKDDVPAQQAALGIDSIGTDSLSWLGVPMVVGERAIGVIAVQSYTTPGVYDERDRDLLSAIANQVAVLIENARLLQEVQHRAEREHTVHAITDRVSRGMSREEIVRIAVEGLGSMLGASTSVARLGTEEQLLAGRQRPQDTD